MRFEIVGELRSVVTIARGVGVRDRRRLARAYGERRWLKRKAIATVRLPNGRMVSAEVHWYEAHGVGRRELKVKRLLED